MEVWAVTTENIELQEFKAKNGDSQLDWR